MQTKKELIHNLEDQQQEMKRWAQDLKCEATNVLLERAKILRELDTLKREVYIHEKGVTKITRQNVEAYNTGKIEKMIKEMSPDELKNLVTLLQGEIND